jgi:hypothetical protein
VPSLWRVYLCVSLFLCSPLFALSLLPRPVQLALLPRSLRLRPSAAPSTSSSSRRYFVRSWLATARPRVSGSAVSSSATPIASNDVLLPTLRQPKPSLGKPWEDICFRLRLRPHWVAIWPFRSLARKNDGQINCSICAAVQCEQRIAYGLRSAQRGRSRTQRIGSPALNSATCAVLARDSVVSEFRNEPTIRGTCSLLTFSKRYLDDH